mgnify:CR=1 FL=1
MGNILNDIDLLFARTINNNPRLNAKQLLTILKEHHPSIAIDIIKNSIKRKLIKYVEFKGSDRNGGYHIIWKKKLVAKKIN